MANIVRATTGLAWGLFALTNATLLFGMQGLPLWLQLLLLGFSLIALAWLLLRYNRLLAQWRVAGLVWLTYCLLRLFSVWCHAGGIPFLRDNLATLAMLLAIEAMLTGWFALLVLVIRRDVSLAYLVIFFALGAPLIRALVIEAGGVLNFLIGQTAEEPFHRFSVTEPLIMSLSCMGTLGFIAFLPHLVWLLIKELRGRWPNKG